MVRGFEMVDIYSACWGHLLGITRLAERDSVLQDNMIDEEKAKAEEAAQVSSFLCFRKWWNKDDQCRGPTMKDRDHLVLKETNYLLLRRNLSRSWRGWRATLATSGLLIFLKKPASLFVAIFSGSLASLLGDYSSFQAKMKQVLKIIK